MVWFPHFVWCAVVLCPPCLDTVSGIDVSGVIFDVADRSQPFSEDFAQVVRVFGPLTQYRPLVLGLPTKMADRAQYSATCVCFNRANLALNLTTNNITTDFSAPTCVFSGRMSFPNGTVPLTVTWTCWDDGSGIQTGSLYWRLGTAPGASDAVTRRRVHTSVTATSNGLSSQNVSIVLADVMPAAGSLHLVAGQEYFVTVEAANGAGTVTTLTSDAIVVGVAPPSVTDVGLATPPAVHNGTAWFVSAFVPLALAWNTYSPLPLASQTLCLVWNNTRNVSVAAGCVDLGVEQGPQVVAHASIASLAPAAAAAQPRVVVVRIVASSTYGDVGTGVSQLYNVVWSTPTVSSVAIVSSAAGVAHVTCTTHPGVLWVRWLVTAQVPVASAAVTVYSNGVKVPGSVTVFAAGLARFTSSSVVVGGNFTACVDVVDIVQGASKNCSLFTTVLAATTRWFVNALVTDADTVTPRAFWSVSNVGNLTVRWTESDAAIAASCAPPAVTVSIHDVLTRRLWYTSTPVQGSASRHAPRL